MRFVLHDPTLGVDGGGQRWTKDLADWLSKRGHVCRVDSSRNPGPAPPGSVWLDMSGIGDISLYPDRCIPYIWWHVPTSFKHEKAAAVSVLASSKWSEQSFRSIWKRPAKVVPLFTASEGFCGDTGVLFLGRLTLAKGVLAALRLRDALQGTGPVTIAGATWSTPPDLTRALQGSNVLANPTPTRVDNLYREHKVFWQLAGLDSGPPEAFGLAAADAFARGMIVVAYAAGAIPEWLPERFLADSERDILDKTTQALRGGICPPTEEEIAVVRPRNFAENLRRVGVYW